MFETNSLLVVLAVTVDAVTCVTVVLVKLPFRLRGPRTREVWDQQRNLTSWQFYRRSTTSWLSHATMPIRPMCGTFIPFYSTVYLSTCIVSRYAIFIPWYPIKINNSLFSVLVILLLLLLLLLMMMMMDVVGWRQCQWQRLWKRELQVVERCL